MAIYGHIVDNIVVLNHDNRTLSACTPFVPPFASLCYRLYCAANDAGTNL